MKNKMCPKTIYCILLCTILTGLSGCETVKTAENPSPTPTLTEQTEWEGEPSLSPDAQKKLQFSKLTVGESCAEIIVEEYGSIYIRFFPQIAPKAVDNFLTHAREGYYDNTIFHRVLADFMIQGGDPKGTGYGGESIYGKAFEDEISKELELFRGALCMANTGIDSNQSQFFLVQADAESVKQLKELIEYKNYSMEEYCKAAYNTILDEAQIKDYLTFGGAPWLSGHHTVFGQVYDGFDVLDAITYVETDEKNRPVHEVVVKTVRIFSYEG